ncbi:hypothetical protein Z954_03190 [Clostridium botulinum C/D str. BKT2873]|nr:hypothetical protein Z952_12055 [Clostridium botulinum C/D str. BKT75002]KEI07912.1 hypothetical protein Z954_03190 [Clostridium botulinum C/D str. BKT2873]
MNEYEDYLFEEEKSDNTIKAYKKDIEQFYEIVDKQNPASIAKKDIIVYKRALRSLKLSAYTINRKLTAISCYIKFLNTKKDFKIIVEIKKEKIQKQKCLKEILNKTDYRRMLYAAERAEDKRAVALFKCLYLTGMRISEVLQLTPEDIEEHKIYVLGKGSKERMVIIPVELKKAFVEYLAIRKDTGDKLFTGKCGNLNRQGAHCIIKKYASKAKVKLSKAHAHAFRHLYGILGIRERGLTMDEVADLLGHSDINTTRIYTRRTEEELIKIADKFE